jgi:hypothetical protein
MRPIVRLLLKARSAATDFIARPASARPLAALRIGLAAVLLAQTASLAGSLNELYGSLGLAQRPVTEAMTPPGVPRLGWATDALAACGVPEADAIRAAFGVYAASLVALLLGWRTRPAAAVAWLAHLMFKAGNPTTYGVDEFAHIALFYCVWLPVGRAWSLDVRAGRASDAASPAARLGQRVVQFHLCVVYLASGLEKASGEQWWSGEAVWRALMRTDLGSGAWDFAWLAEIPWVAKCACWGTLAVELGYAFLIWPARTRRLWGAATIGLHLGIAVFMGLWSFSAVMVVLTTAAFLVPAETGGTSRASGTRPDVSTVTR